MKLLTGMLLMSSILLTACGGGGGGSGGGNTVEPSRTVVFRANDGTNLGLWAGVDDGSNLYRLDPDFELMINIPIVADFKISPDKAWVAFQTQDSNGSGIRLWVTSMQGGTPIEIITFANTSTRIKDYSWSPSSDALVYLADQDTLGVDEVYLAKVDGTGVDKISIPASDREMQLPQWSPNGRYILFEVFNTADSVSIGIDVHDRQNPVPAARRISVAATQPSTFLTWTTWSPDSSRVAYIFNPTLSSERELWVSIPDGSASTRINPAPTNGGTGLREIDWSPDSSKLAFISRQRNNLNSEVYVANADGSGSPELQHTPFSSSDTWGATEVKWSPDGAHLAYLSDHGLVGAYQLYVVTDKAENLDAAVLVSSFSGAVRKWDWLPNSTGIIYGGLVFGSLDRLYKKDTLAQHSLANPPAPEEFLSPAPGGYGDVGDFIVSPDSQGVIYLHLWNAENAEELFANKAAGGTAFILHTPFQNSAGDRTIDSYQWSPNSERIIYVNTRRDVGSLTGANVWATDLDGTNQSLLSGSMNAVLTGGKGLASY